MSVVWTIAHVIVELWALVIIAFVGCLAWCGVRDTLRRRRDVARVRRLARIQSYTPAAPSRRDRVFLDKAGVKW